MQENFFGRKNKIDQTSQVIDSKIAHNNSIFRYATVKNTHIYDYCSIGDFSKVENSTLMSYVRIQRYNYVLDAIIDKHSYTGMNTVIMHSDIGKFTSISWGVTIGPANHDYERVTNHSFLYNKHDNLRPNNKIAYNRFKDRNLVGSDVWIGCNSTILRDVKIGNGAVIGANSLVNKDVPPYAIVAGNPAKVIKYRFKERIIKELLNIKWWNFPDDAIKRNFNLFSRKMNFNIVEKLIELKKSLKMGEKR